MNTPEGWALERVKGTGHLGAGIVVRNTKTQGWFDFYKQRDAIAFAFLDALAAAQPATAAPAQPGPEAPAKAVLLTDERIDLACQSEPAAVYELMYGLETTVGRFNDALRVVSRAVERAVLEANGLS